MVDVYQAKRNIETVLSWLEKSALKEDAVATNIHLQAFKTAAAEYQDTIGVKDINDYVYKAIAIINKRQEKSK